MTEHQTKIIASLILKLRGLNIGAEYHHLEEGPVVTGYYFKLKQSTPIDKMISKEEDFALAVEADSILISRKGGFVCIEIPVPKEERVTVDFKDCLHWVCTNPDISGENPKIKLPIALGVDTLGNKSVLDLTTCPHLLLAGSTGSGKSVFEASLISNLSICRTPEELQMYLVDAKQLDLPLFEQLPHVKQVVKTLDEFYTMATDLFIEDKRRKTLLIGLSCRNINEYNNMVGKQLALPYILLLIDEFAELLALDASARLQDKQLEKELRTYADKDPVDKIILRMVQTFRAVGIHIICATQRSSVKIINGDIKANFLCRISLKLSNGFDSRTILDESGAEYLLGKGDMLIKTPTEFNLKRYHGPYVDLGDITNVVVQNENIRKFYKEMVVKELTV